MKAEEDTCDCISSGVYACTEWNNGFPGQNWPAECKPVVSAIEDTWSVIGLRFLQENPVPSIDPIAYEGTEIITVTIEVHWGALSIYGLDKYCPDQSTNFATDPAADNLVCNVCNATGNACSTIKEFPSTAAVLTDVQFSFIRETSLMPKARVLKFSGQYTAVDAAMQNLTYKAEPYQNYLRLKSRYLSAKTAQLLPFEEMIISIAMLDRMVANISQIVHIVDVNNAPTLVNPTTGWKESPICTADPLTTLEECHFGQFFRYEDTDKILAIPNTKASDIDLFEECSYAFPECKKVDANIATLKGMTGLNTRVGLAVYQDEKGTDGVSRLGFGGFLARVNSAIQVLFYQVESQTMVNQPGSTVLNYNTMTGSANLDLVGQVEYITVTVSDQGSTGADGVSEIVSTQIPITIVAVNDAPVITSSFLEFAAQEDIVFGLKGIVVSDVDLNEVIVSSLADLDWQKAAENQYELNKISITISVTRGNLYLNYFRNIFLNFTKETSYVSIAGWLPNFYNADWCRYQSKIGLGTDEFTIDFMPLKSVCHLANVGSSVCATGSSNTIFGSFCGDSVTQEPRTRNKWDDFRRKTFDLIATQDRTCGGLPLMMAPNNFSFGKACSDCQSGKPCLTCAANSLVKCQAYVQGKAVQSNTCRCCANLTKPCSTDTDCQGEPFSLCGCSPGAPIVAGIGKSFTAPGVCGPYKDASTIPLIFRNEEWKGQSCTYTGPGSDLCRSAIFAYSGTALSSILETLGTSGTKELSGFGSLTDMNRLLDGVLYLTDLNYNRRYRIPVAQRDPATFKIENDDLDTYTIIAGDNGNSGGSQRDPKITTKNVNIRVAAVNDRPEIDAPTSISAVEDVKFAFSPENLAKVKCPDPNIRQAIYGTLMYHCLPVQILDPDYMDYDFANKLFILNITVANGKVFLNETFLAQAEAKKNCDASVQCGPETRLTCCKCAVEVMDGCSIGYNQYGRDWYTSRGTRPSGLHSYGAPEFGVGNKFLSLQGTYADLNLALLGLTYLSDPNFNTRYGIPESITIEADDQGDMGDNYFTTRHLKGSTIISVLVDSVNDPPVIGRALSVQTQIPGVFEAEPSRVVNVPQIIPIDETLNIKDNCLQVSVTSKA
eukprot:403861-Hanusia_phi.AAC.7